MRSQLQAPDHALLGRDEADLGMQPRAQSLDRIGFSGEPVGQIAELIDLVTIDRLEKRLARREMPVECANPNFRATRHRFQAGLWAAGGENLGRRFQTDARD